jgi:hypothetical protein
LNFFPDTVGEFGRLDWGVTGMEIEIEKRGGGGVVVEATEGGVNEFPKTDLAFENKDGAGRGGEDVEVGRAGAVCSKNSSFVNWKGDRDAMV